tara:strand:- start:127 stop:516 length:390 start_codon:yes stop_codon:yes gene_type:complete
VAEKKPTILDVSIVHEQGLTQADTIFLGLEKVSGRLYVFTFDKYQGELGDWTPGRYLKKNTSGQWQSNHSFSTTGAICFDTFEEICDYWNQNMILHDTVSRGSKEWEDSILNGYICEMSEGMASLSHVG